jgi:hypothetical protein
MGGVRMSLQRLLHHWIRLYRDWQIHRHHHHHHFHVTTFHLMVMVVCVAISFFVIYFSNKMQDASWESSNSFLPLDTLKQKDSLRTLNPETKERLKKMYQHDLNEGDQKAVKDYIKENKLQGAP